MAKKELILEGLDCANCAIKIETQVKSIPGVVDASVDFVSQRLTMEVDNIRELDSIVKKASSIATSIESGISILENDEEGIAENEKENKRELIILGIGILFFTLGFILPLPPIVENIVFLVSYLFVGIEVLMKAIKNIFKGQVFDENFLMAIATIGAFAIGQFPEAVSVMLFYQIGELFQDMAVNRSRKSIKSLMDIRPDYANLKLENTVKKVSPEKISVGDLILVKPGERIPLDGIIVDGASTLDTSALTGESLPRKVKTNDEVLSGSINQEGLLTIKVSKLFGESTVSKILDLVQNAGSKKAPTENFITKFARYYTPAVVISAVLLAVIPPIFIPGESFSIWLYRALVFLVISCPCALVISIPLGFFGGIGGASKKGILIKGSNYLEALNNVHTIVFDKTGTLTKGVFKVTKIDSKGNLSKESLLEYSALAESYSTHPIAVSILNDYKKNIDKSRISEVEEISGHGIRAMIDGKEVLAGNKKLMDKYNIKVDSNATGSVVYIAINRNYEGMIIISDEIKVDSMGAIRELKSLGISKIAMLTGDNDSTAKEVATSLELDDFYSQLLPHEKVKKLEILHRQLPKKQKLIFVGDGINDAPVLARADIGIAMGG